MNRGALLNVIQPNCPEVLLTCSAPRIELSEVAAARADCVLERLRLPAPSGAGSKTVLESQLMLERCRDGHSHAHRHRFARAQVQ